jgi:flagellar motor switch protein FliN/FliY
MGDLQKQREAGVKAIDSLKQTLSALLSKEVNVEMELLPSGNPAELIITLKDSYVCSNAQVTGSAQGAFLLITREQEASVLADLLIGQDGTSAPEQVSELYLSAFSEVVHQIAESIVVNLKQVSNTSIDFQIQETLVTSTQELPSRFASLGDGMVTGFKFKYHISDLPSGEILACFPEKLMNIWMALEKTKKTTAAVSPSPVAPAVASSSSKNQNQSVAVSTTAPSRGGVIMSQYENVAAPANIGLLMDVPLRLTVELGRTSKLVKEILSLAPGAIVELDKLAGEPVDILVNEKLIAKGEVVVIDENFGVRITEIINPEERLAGLQL